MARKYARSELNKAVQRKIKEKEKHLGRTCRTIWEFTNPIGETFLFASFCKNRDRLIVTLAHYSDLINKWIPC